MLGYDWCVTALKSSEYARLAGDLEISKAITYLKQRQVVEAIDTLKAFGNDSTIAASAAVNLSFIYYQVRETPQKNQINSFYSPSKRITTAPRDMWTLLKELMHTVQRVL